VKQRGKKGVHHCGKEGSLNDGGTVGRGIRGTAMAEPQKNSGDQNRKKQGHRVRTEKDVLRTGKWRKIHKGKVVRKTGPL